MNGPPARLAAIHQLIHGGRLEQARVGLGRVLRQSPGDTDANSMMCFVLSRMGHHTQALFYARRAADLQPRSASLQNNIANMLVITGDVPGAIAAYTRAREIDPDHLSSLVGLTNALNLGFEYPESEALCRRALELHPGEPHLMAHLAVAMLQTGRAREAVAVLREAAAAHPGNGVVATGLPHTMNYAGDSDPREVLAAHRAFGALVAAAHPGPIEPPAVSLNPDRKLRLGILSGDLRAHAVGFFVEPILERHDRGAMEIYCYSTTPSEDATSARLRAHTAAWRNPSYETIPQLAAMIRRDRIDILLELSGHTAGHRLGVLPLRPAPVQMTYFGYPNTTGVPGCDYRIVDSFTDPATAEYDALATEKLIRLDPCFLCYRPLRGAPEVAPPPSETTGSITFGSFNALAKLDELAIGLHAGALAAAPGSRLILKYHGLRSPKVRDAIAARYAKAGVDPSRLLLEPPGSGAAEMLGAYAKMDIMLDSYPYHGTTTTCEALYMGVPVVTLEGRVCAARVGTSILTNVGHPELVARTPGEYARIAAGLAGDPARLASVRAGLRARMLASPVCDAEGFAARFGAMLRGVWRGYCAAGPAAVSGAARSSSL